MCAEGIVTNNEAEAYYQRMKNARAELVCRFEQFLFLFMLTFVLIVQGARACFQATWFMRHPSPQDDCLGQPSPPNSPPRSRSDVGLCSPSSGTEVIYDSPEEFEDEDVPASSPSPETKKRRDVEFEKSLRRVTNMTQRVSRRGRWMQ